MLAFLLNDLSYSIKAVEGIKPSLLTFSAVNQWKKSLMLMPAAKENKKKNKIKKDVQKSEGKEI